MTPSARLETPSIAQQIQGAVQRGELALPPLPEIALRLMELMKQEWADPASIAALIEKDPAMAASILRIANSASFGGLRAISDLGDAIMRIGMRQVGALVTAVAHRGHFNSSDPELKRTLQHLWDQSIAAAQAARVLTGAASGDDRTEAYLAGLLHDTGKLLVLKGIDDIERRSGESLTPSVVEELMELLHAELGYVTLKAWRIPDSVCRVAQRHHDPDPSSDDLLLIRAQAADAIARKLFPITAADRELNLLEVPAIERLNLGDLELAALLVDVEDEISQVRTLF